MWDVCCRDGDVCYVCEVWILFLDDDDDDGGEGRRVKGGNRKGEERRDKKVERSYRVGIYIYISSRRPRVSGEYTE